MSETNPLARRPDNIFARGVGRRSTAEDFRREARFDRAPKDAADWWRRQIEFRRLSSEEKLAFRIVPVWRWTRTLLRLAGADAGRPLEELLTTPEGLSWWEDGLSLARGSPPLGAEGSLWAILSGTNSCGTRKRTPLPIRPPRIPEDWIAGTGEVGEGYDPSDPEIDPDLHRWMLLWEQAGSWLGFDRGLARDPNFATLSLDGMTSPWEIRTNWPRLIEVIDFDAKILGEGTDLYVKRGTTPLTTWLAAEYGLIHAEIVEIVFACRDRVGSIHAPTTKQVRASLLARAEAAYREAQENGDSRGVLNALKLIGQLAGVTREEPDTSARMYESARDGATSQKQDAPKVIGVSDFVIAEHKEEQT